MSEPEHTTNDDDDAAPAEDETHPDFEGSPDAEPEGAPEPEPEQPEGIAEPTDAELEKARKDLKKEATAHANRIGKIMGEAAQALVPCELCLPLMPGFHWPGADAIQSEEQRAAVLAVVGAVEPDAPPLREAEGVEMCPRCDGWGELTYPTRRDHTARQPCPRCIGTGYVEAAAAPSNVSHIVTTTTTGTAATYGSALPCPKCGQVGMLDQPHWCAPAASASA